MCLIWVCFCCLFVVLYVVVAVCLLDVCVLCVLRARVFSFLQSTRMFGHLVASCGVWKRCKQGALLN